MGNQNDSCNEVRLIGRVSAPAEERELPSGDQLVTFRVVVPRSKAKATGRTGRSPTVDTIDIACFTAVTRRRAVGLSEGERVEVRGALRRRFFRAGGAAQSRYDVEAVKLARAAAE